MGGVLYAGGGAPRVDRVLMPIDISRMIPRLTVPFHVTVPAATAWTDTAAYTIPARGRITKVVCIFPPGPAGLLHLRPLILRHGTGADGEQIDLLQYIGDLAFINGDSQERVFVMDYAVDPADNDLLVIRYENVDAVFPHELIVDVEVAFDMTPYAGVQRVNVADLAGVNLSGR